jgi:hypothetical protein
MTRLIACAFGVVLFAATPSAANVDPRLATFKKAYVVATDDLDHDQRVAACVVDHLHAKTALEVVNTKDAADVILRVRAHLTNSASRAVLGTWGASPSGHVQVQLPDGTTLWAAGAKFRRETGTITRAKAVECGVADALLAALQGAIRKARNGT